MLNFRFAAWPTLILCIGCFVQPSFAAENETQLPLHLKSWPRQSTPKLAPASNEPEIALKKFSVAPGFRLSVFAAEPMLANPVAFSIDEQGRIFVSETYRYKSSALDIRNYMEMLDADLACRSVEDRLKMTEKYFGPEAKQLAVESEIIRLVEDRNHDGKADFSSTYADGFDSALDGIASGVLARHGTVWFANIPELWELHGLDKTGHATSRKVLSHGYGVRFSYTGHDLHGLILGPDGKLYFSIGDRGSNVKTQEGKTLFYPDEGAVFRCNPDGSDLEVIHHGLRNPQELAFDEFGNLFTGDNDFDHGDHERWVYVVEGADSGWRVGYQHPPLGYTHVPWMADQLWVPHFDGQAAYILPPITNIDDGPSGLTYYPGTGLSSKWDGHFFLCHFKGSAARSGIKSFTVKPSGASFELIDAEPFVWNVQATDVDFGPDSQIYFSDWGEGWEQTYKGRIYRATETNFINAPIVEQTKNLLAKGFEKTSQRNLLKLLSHPNMRVRLEAQYELASRGKKSVRDLTKLSRDTNANPRARRHAIWALGQIGREQSKVSNALIPLLADSDAEIRAQAAKVLGDNHVADSFSGLVSLLADSSLRVRFFAAQGLAKLKRTDAVQPILTMLRENNDKDIYLRQAGVFALSRCADIRQLTPAAKDGSDAVRMAVLLAMRQMQRPEIAEFLNDKNDLLVVEAARAINDVPINDAMPKLAEFISSDKTFSKKHAKQFQALHFRTVNANSRIGTADGAKALANYAASDSSLDAPAAEALRDLANWSEPGTRDRVVGVYRPFVGERDSQTAASALEPVIAKILSNSRSGEVKLAAIDAVENLKLTSASSSLQQLFSDKKNSEKVRVAALSALGKLNPSSLAEVVKVAQNDSSELIRKEANRLATQIDPTDAVAQIRAVLEKGSIPEKQGAIASLGTISGAEAEKTLAQLFDKLAAGNLPREVELELLDAAAKHPTAELKEKVAQYNAQHSSGTLAGFHESLFGGDADAGKKIFFERAEASCVRCHQMGKTEGGNVGPLLTGIGSRKPREYLLESIVHPNAQIAPGFDTVLVLMKSGASYAGVFKSENEKELMLNSPEDGLVKIPKADIKSRNRGASGMPDGMGQILSKRDLRDLVEFLATSK